MGRASPCADTVAPVARAGQVKAGVNNKGSWDDKRCDSRDRIAGRGWGTPRLRRAQWAVGALYGRYAHGTGGVRVDDWRSGGRVYGDRLWAAHWAARRLLWHLWSWGHESLHGCGHSFAGSRASAGVYHRRARAHAPPYVADADRSSGAISAPDQVDDPPASRQPTPDAAPRRAGGHGRGAGARAPRATRGPGASTRSAGERHQPHAVGPASSTASGGTVAGTGPPTAPGQTTATSVRAFLPAGHRQRRFAAVHRPAAPARGAVAHGQGFPARGSPVLRRRGVSRPQQYRGGNHSGGRSSTGHRLRSRGVQL